MTQTLSLQTVLAWLQAKPAQAVICWDTFEPRHGLLVSFYQEQGYVHVRSEYEQAVIDPGDHQKITPLALYDHDLARFNYAVHYTPLRFRPTAGDLLAYAHSAHWMDQPHGIPQYMPPIDEYNAIQDRDDRPQDLPWHHREYIAFRDERYLVRSSLYPKNFGGPDRIDPEYGPARHVDLIIDAGQDQIPFISYRLPPTHFPGSGSCDYSFSYGGWYRLTVRLYDQESITLLTSPLTQNGTLLGVWQRHGERLVREERKDERL